jgi:hypothetical protein
VPLRCKESVITGQSSLPGVAFALLGEFLALEHSLAHRAFRSLIAALSQLVLLIAGAVKVGDADFLQWAELVLLHVPSCYLAELQDIFYNPFKGVRG